MPNENPVALVTGSTRGLGIETSRQLGRLGLKVLVSGRDHNKASDVARGLAMQGIDAEGLELDVSDSTSITRAISTVCEQFGRLDVLVNNAAILTDIGTQPTDVDEATLRQNLAVNFTGPYLLTAGCSELLLTAPSGRVLNMGTQVGSFGNLADTESPLKDDICPAYQASKIALNAMTALFAKEFASTSVRINSVCPGWVMTDMGHGDLPDYGDAVKPLTPDEAVRQFIHLATPGTDIPHGQFISAGASIPW